MEILTNFGVEPKLLLAQVVNFLIILFLLKKFFYAKITKVLDERKTKIAESLKNADLIEAKLQQTEEQVKEALEIANVNAKEIIDSTNKEAQRVYDEAQKEAKTAAEAIIIKAKAEIQSEREQMKNTLEKDTITLVADVVKKVLGRNLTTKEKQALNSKAMTEIINSL